MSQWVKCVSNFSAAQEFRPWSWSWSGSSRTLAWLDRDSDLNLNWPDCRKWTRPWHASWIAGSICVDGGVRRRTQTEPKDRGVVLQKCCAQDVWTTRLKQIANKKAWCRWHFHFVYHLCRDGSVSRILRRLSFLYACMGLLISFPSCMVCLNI